ncbi:MAG: acyl-CoA carboxylase subunit beta [Spirochaetia bacterium]
MSHQDAINHLRSQRDTAHAGGGEARIEAQHGKGKLTARERIEEFVDPGSFVEHQTYIRGRSEEFGLGNKRNPGDGVVTGSAKVGGRQIWLAAQDFTVLGGSLGEMHARRIADAQVMAMETGSPFIAINDSGGARIQEGILSLEGYGEIFRNNTLASGVIPQISVILGPCAGGAVYSPAITDFVCMVGGVSNMFITGPDVIRAVTGEEISQEDLGGADAHASKSGVAHCNFADEQSGFAFLRKLLGYLPSNNREQPPIVESDDPTDRSTALLLEIIPEDEKRAYDMTAVVGQVLDQDSFLEVHAQFARNIVVGLGKLAGRTVGVIANQPLHLAAVLDIDAADKAARFVRFCDAFNVPILSFVDVPGFLPGVGQEHGGIIRHGAKLLFAIAEATVPKIALIVRKAYGGAFISMSSKALGYDRVLALPIAQIAVMGAEGAANVVFRRDIKESDDPEQTRKEKISEFRETVMDPFIAAGLGYVDDIVNPADCRIEIIRSMEIMARKREDRPYKKHGNIPL